MGEKKSAIVFVGPSFALPLYDLLTERFLPGTCLFEQASSYDDAFPDIPVPELALRRADVARWGAGDRAVIVAVAFRASGWVERRGRRIRWEFPEPDTGADDFRVVFESLYAAFAGGTYMSEMGIAALFPDREGHIAVPVAPWVFRQEVCLRNDVSDEEFSAIRHMSDRGAYPFAAPFGGIFETLCCAPDLVREVATDEILGSLRAGIPEDDLRSLLRRRYEDAGEEPSHPLGDGYYL